MGILYEQRRDGIMIRVMGARPHHINVEIRRTLRSPQGANLTWMTPKEIKALIQLWEQMQGEIQGGPL